MKISQTTSQPIQNKPVTSSDVSAAGAAKRSEKSESPQATSAKQIDAGAAKTEISGKAKEFVKAKEVAAKAPDVRDERIAELKARIAAGKYEVNAQAIADKMVDDHIATGIG